MKKSDVDQNEPFLIEQLAMDLFYVLSAHKKSSRFDGVNKERWEHIADSAIREARIKVAGKEGR